MKAIADTGLIVAFGMSELFPQHTVITLDEEDFRIYRRNSREMIPLLCPPKTSRR